MPKCENSVKIILFVIAVIFITAGCKKMKPNESASDRSEANFAFKIVKDQQDKYWFQDPDGKKFLSVGINHVVSYPFKPKPGSEFYNPVKTVFAGDYNRWKADVIKLMKNAGFNTFGSWSDPKLVDDGIYNTICVYVAKHHLERCMDGFLPDFEEKVRQNVKFILKDYDNVDNVFGVFLDNEMSWYGESPWTIVRNYTLLEKALRSKDDPHYGQNSPYYKIASDFLKEKYKTIEAFSQAWDRSITSWDDLSFELARSGLNDTVRTDRDEFTALAAEKFYSRAAKVVREMLPGKLILGTRFAQKAPEGVIRACGKYCDVISFNDYRKLPKADEHLLAKYWIWGGKKPLMVTEYAWRAEENTSGNPNSGGAGAVVKTQAQRAENYQKYVGDLLSYPMIIGAHWFEFADQSPQGRFDGENSNYGVVDIHHRPYTELLTAMKQTNDRLEKLHAQSDRQVPKSLPKPKEVVFEASQRPERSPSIDLLAMIPVKDPELFHAPDASIELKKSDDHLVIPIDTGNKWGCGILFFGPEKFKNSVGPEYSTDLDGYSAIELDAVIGEETIFDIFLDEAGIDAPDAVSYDLSAGDDGESFVIPFAKGQGERFLYRFELKDIKPRKDWGNQKGLRRVDMHAMKGVAIFFHGGQKIEQVHIFSLKLVR